MGFFSSCTASSLHRLIIAPPHIITAPALATAVTALLVGAQWGCRLGVAHRFLHPPVRPALVVADAQDTANVSARNVSSLRSFLLVFLSLSLIIIHTTIHIPLSNYYVKLRQTALLASHPPIHAHALPQPTADETHQDRCRPTAPSTHDKTRQSAYTTPTAILRHRPAAAFRQPAAAEALLLLLCDCARALLAPCQPSKTNYSSLPLPSETCC